VALRLRLTTGLPLSVMRNRCKQKTPTFGNPADSGSESRGFASPPHDGFALVAMRIPNCTVLEGPAPVNRVSNRCRSDQRWAIKNPNKVTAIARSDARATFSRHTRSDTMAIFSSSPRCSDQEGEASSGPTPVDGEDNRRDREDEHDQDSAQDVHDCGDFADG